MARSRWTVISLLAAPVPEALANMMREERGGGPYAGRPIRSDHVASIMSRQSCRWNQCRGNNERTSADLHIRIRSMLRSWKRSGRRQVRIFFAGFGNGFAYAGGID